MGSWWSWAWGLLLGMAGGAAAHFAGPLDPSRLLRQQPARMRKMLVWGSVARLLVSLVTLLLAFLLLRSAGPILATLIGLLLVRGVALFIGVRSQRGRGG